MNIETCESRFSEMGNADDGTLTLLVAQKIGEKYTPQLPPPFPYTNTQYALIAF